MNTTESRLSDAIGNHPLAYAATSNRDGITGGDTQSGDATFECPRDTQGGPSPSRACGAGTKSLPAGSSPRGGRGHTFAVNGSRRRASTHFLRALRVLLRSQFLRLDSPR